MEDKLAEARSMEDKLAEARSHVAHMLSLRSAREARWRELSKWLCPHRGIFSGLDEDFRERERLLRFTHAASQALARGASGMTSGMTPRNIAWFKSAFTEEDMAEASGARAWLDAFDRRMRDCLANGGFYQAIHAFNTDLVWAGCGLLYCERGAAAPLRFECAQVGTYCVALDRDGGLEAVARLLRMTPAILASVFGKENMSARSLGGLECLPHEPLNVWHLCRKGRARAGMAVESLYWEEGGEGFLRRSGFHEMPFFFTRWHEGRDAYGTGPGDEALADARQMDILERNKLEGLRKLVRPPVQAPSSLKGIVDLSPGGINYVPERVAIEPIMDLSPYARAIQFVQAEIQNVSRRLEAELMAAIFASMPLEQRPRDMSATEFLERKREALQQMGPVISAYEPNVLTPLLRRVALSLDRAGLAPPPPQSLAGQPLLMKMDFISPMANALRQTGAETTRAIFTDVAQMLQATGKAEILDKIDLDQMVDELATGLGCPGKIIRADSDVAALRQQRAQAQEQELALRQMAAENELATSQAIAARERASAMAALREDTGEKRNG